MVDWPASWAGSEEDEIPGRGLVTELRPFIIYLSEQGLSRKTVRRHLDNVWLIGGEIIRSLNYEPKLRRKPARQLLLNAIDTGEAPLAPHATEAEQRGLDATARKLLKFLTANGDHAAS